MRMSAAGLKGARAGRAGSCAGRGAQAGAGAFAWPKERDVVAMAVGSRPAGLPATGI